jgi:hypothetical protein
MILWVAVSLALAVVTIAAVGLGAAMSQAERRARRNLYRALGVGDEAADLLIVRHSDVLSELARLRRSPVASDAAAAASDTPGAEGHEPLSDPDAAPLRPQGGLRLARPNDGRFPAASAPRAPYVGRHRRL